VAGLRELQSLALSRPMNDDKSASLRSYHHSTNPSFENVGVGVVRYINIYRSVYKVIGTWDIRVCTNEPASVIVCPSSAQ
jgi:hypothetical protein